MNNKIISFILFTIISCSSAMADCYYNGEQYEEGERVNGFVCKNGSWK